MGLLALLLGACAGAPARTEAPQPQTPVAGVPEPAGEPILFDEDPFGSGAAPLAGGAAPGVTEVAPLAGGAEADTVVVPFESLGGLEEIAAPAMSEEVLQRNTELTLAMLRARTVLTELENTSRVIVDPGPYTFGDEVQVRFESRNPFGENLELVPPADGLILEVSWEVRRWLPIDGNDRVLRQRWYRLPGWFALGADQSWWEQTSLKLEVEGEPGALWTLKVHARLRCAGARLGGQELPLHAFDFASASLIALPPGWEKYQADPLGTLERLADLPGAGADRHVLVCTALLSDRRQRRAGLDLLLDKVATLGQEGGISPRRAVSFCTALQWLTGLEDMGNMPADWLVWKRRVEGRGETPQDEDAR